MSRLFCTVIVVAALLAGMAMDGAGARSDTRERKTPRGAAAVIDLARPDAALLARLVGEYANAERRRAGLGTLGTDGVLERLAGEHSRDMARRSYFSHDTKRVGRDVSFGDRIRQSGAGFSSSAENLALQPVVRSMKIVTRTEASGERSQDVTRDIATYDSVARSAVSGWMESPGHRQNLLTPGFTHAGVGVAFGEREGLLYAYITQDLARAAQ